jgi:hypothetical protein
VTISVFIGGAGRGCEDYAVAVKVAAVPLGHGVVGPGGGGIRRRGKRTMDAGTNVGELPRAR